MRDAKPAAIYLKDYQPPAYLIDHTELHFDLREDYALVIARLHLRRNEGVAAATPAAARWCGLELLGIRARRRRMLAADRYSLTDSGLEIAAVPAQLPAGVQDPDPPPGQHLAGRAVQVPLHVLHPVRGARLSQDHLLPRPARCDVGVHGNHGGGQCALPGAAEQRQSRRHRRPAGRAAPGPLARSLSQAGLPVCAGGR